MEVLVALSVVACIALIVAAIQIARYRGELRHMAQFLDSEVELSGARLTSTMRNRRVLSLAHAINAQLDIRQHNEKVMLAKDRELRDGFAYLSHDIRTPLMGARGYLQLALEENDPAESLRYAQAVDERLGSLQTILDQLFLFTRVSNEGYALVRTKLSLAEVLGESLVAHVPEFEERGWTPTIIIEDPDCEGSSEGLQPLSLVLADRDALKRMFENLVANMLKHGSGEPSIVQEGTRVTFSNLVENPSKLDTELLFERFYKGQESANDKGSGLGLAIVAQLAEAMGARVEATITRRSYCELLEDVSDRASVNNGDTGIQVIGQTAAPVEGDKAYLHIALSFTRQ